MENRLIINIEYFLQCAGHCSGCFLSDVERNEKNTYEKKISETLNSLVGEHSHTKYDEIIIGFGRGNLLNLSEHQLQHLLGLMEHTEKSLNYKKIKFEVSTSLIGKLDKMIASANFLLDKNRNIVFNMVINSEIMSESFWKNYKAFSDFTKTKREGWGWTDETGDILVLNINPDKLPNLDLIDKYFGNNKSPLNVSLFPFVNGISKEKLNTLSDWSLLFFNRFKDKDLNIKNFLETLNSFESESIMDIMNHHEKSISSYLFINKDGEITNGSLSTMGEVDYPRLIEKYKIKPDFKTAFTIMQKSPGCINCQVKSKCLLSGAYLTALSNYSLIGKTESCLNGYQKIFEIK